ncbi:hypothetical protein BABINDRAFT_159728 [Babjeviella inositovora NRRL Y-12698]|uniref:Actin n=1 Tax=Babjeviella inositovora NRRL Y-12698 TaxID=984486 RepID=A0A1E3QV21_9ASCO|nr:uncharacterized protein BABINDRAFT_159728 [Babjeviella inositovora NRRL Y-12698]ODQ81434.1 hypothetical protein BABINDRAFT_159728 [Babjeviella inositovora NRRL Y-12698]
MDSTIASVVIDNGAATTKAGVSSDEIPSLVFPTSYSQNANTQEVVVGDEIHAHPANDVYTLMKHGMIYNWDNIIYNWEHVYASLQLVPQESPLVMTENVWNTAANKAKTCELAFENLQVPIFSLVKSPLCVTYGMGKATGLVIDIGSSVASVTPILDGAILAKGLKHSRFAGDFLDLHVMNYLTTTHGLKLDSLLPARFANVAVSQSFKTYQIGSVLDDFKSSITALSNFPLSLLQQYQTGLKHYQLPDGKVLPCGPEQLHLAEPLFQPISYALPPPYTIAPSAAGGPQQQTGGLMELVLASLKSLEANGDVYGQLLSNIIITGGGSLLQGLETRLLNDLNRFLPNFNISYYSSSGINSVERKFGSWVGASCLSSIGDDGLVSGFDSGEGLFVSKQDYEEFGVDSVVQRFS